MKNILLLALSFFLITFAFSADVKIKKKQIIVDDVAKMYIANKSYKWEPQLVKSIATNQLIFTINPINVYGSSAVDIRFATYDISVIAEFENRTNAIEAMFEMNVFNENGDVIEANALQFKKYFEMKVFPKPETKVTPTSNAYFDALQPYNTLGLIYLINSLND